MTVRKFLTSVADVFGYDNDENLIFTGKTLLDSSVEVSLGSAPIRGGKGNQLQYIYYHTGEMKFTLTDTQWNPALIAATVGSSYTEGSGANVYSQEDVSVTVSSNTVTATVLGTPIVWPGGPAIYGWATLPSGRTIRGTFSGQTFTATKATSDVLVTGNTVCIRYLELNNAATPITIEANMIPKVVKLVMEAQLNSGDVTSNKIGMVQIIAPTVTLSGAFTISMKADGVSNTPLTGTALAYTESSTSLGCSSDPYYAKLVEVIDSANWYDNVRDLAVSCQDTIGATNAVGITPVVYAIAYNNSTFIPTANLTFSKVSGTNFTINATTGVITTSSASGTGEFKVVVTVEAVDILTATWTVAVA